MTTDSPTSYTDAPDAWVMLKIHTDTPLYKIFAVWRGGYLDGEAWRLNSGVVSVDQDDDYYYFTGQSGSIYRCSKRGDDYHTGTFYTDMVIGNLIKKAKKEYGVKIEIMPYNSDFVNLY